MRKKVVVAMSGGVDSAVAALLLKRQGYNLVGLFMKNWEEKDGRGICQSKADWEDVLSVCGRINIPCYAVNFSREYWNRVFRWALEEFKKGNTPNPDVLCNREIKFKLLMDKAKELGADFLATGHYCRIGGDEGDKQLLKGADGNKDQSYFLYMLKSSVLRNTLFPLGELCKSSVRQIAREEQLPVAEKKDSTGICFIGERNFKNFLAQYIDIEPGNFENSSGEIVGRHDGVPFYTIGQRRGLALGGPGEAWYVVGKEVSRNVVIVAQGANHPALFSEKLIVRQLTWISELSVPRVPFSCSAKIRYRQNDSPCVIEKIKGETALVSFAEPQRAATPSQAIVFYDGDRCLGGGSIATYQTLS